MVSRSSWRGPLLASGLPGWLTLVAVGCSSEPELGIVSGTVTQGGGPLGGVLVTFMPDPEHKTPGVTSFAVTDESGFYDLAYRGAENPRGAVVGKHVVVIEDFAAENRRRGPAAGVIRVPPQYSLAASTPLKFEVRAGEQTIDLSIDRRRGERP